MAVVSRPRGRLPSLAGRVSGRVAKSGWYGTAYTCIQTFFGLVNSWIP
jgi:hypothetical protein